MMNNLSDLMTLAKNKPAKRLAVCWPKEDNNFAVIEAAVTQALIIPILVGKKEYITERIRKNFPTLKGVTIIDATSEEQAAKFAVRLVRKEQADLIMKGDVSTQTLLREVVNRQTGIRQGKLLSHIAMLDFPSYEKILFCSDVAMNIEPGIDEKIAIIDNMLSVMKAYQYPTPLIGIVSSIEQVNDKIYSSVDASVIKKYYSKKNIAAVVDGPFALDNLVSMTAAQIKGITSSVAGNADGLIFPNLDAGNIFYKTALFLAGASSAGIVVGAKCPIVLTSRADSEKTKLYSIAMAVNYAENI